MKKYFPSQLFAFCLISFLFSACSRELNDMVYDRKKAFILFFLLMLFNLGCAQSIKLEYVSNSFPIKIDAGGNFYTYDTVNLDKHKYILVINNASNWITAESNTRTAFMKVSGSSDYVYLHAPGKTHAVGMDTSTFKGEGYVIKLNTLKVKEINSSDDLYKGSLTIKHNREQAIIKIRGAVAKPPF